MCPRLIAVNDLSVRRDCYVIGQIEGHLSDRWRVGRPSRRGKRTVDFIIECDLLRVRSGGWLNKSPMADILGGALLQHWVRLP